MTAPEKQEELTCPLCKRPAKETHPFKSTFGRYCFGGIDLNVWDHELTTYGASQGEADAQWRALCARVAGEEK